MRMRFCHECQAPLEEGRGFCMKCGASVRASGLLGRLWAGLKSLFTDGGVRFNNSNDEAYPETTPFDTRRSASARIPRAHTEIFVSSSHTIHYEDTSTGEQHTWHSWDDVPEHIRRNIMSADSPAHARIGDLDIRDAGHIELHDDRASIVNEYTSFDELPESMRAILRDLHIVPGGMCGRIPITTRRVERYVVRDELGIERAYDSIADLPPEIRRRIDRLGGPFQP